MVKVFSSSYQWLIPLGLIGEGNYVSNAYRSYAFLKKNNKFNSTNDIDFVLERYLYGHFFLK